MHTCMYHIRKNRRKSDDDKKKLKENESDVVSLSGLLTGDLHEAGVGGGRLADGAHHGHGLYLIVVLGERYQQDVQHSL